MYVYMYVCMHVCMYACMYVCVYALIAQSDSAEASRAHVINMLSRLHKLESQLGALTEFNVKLAEELQARQTLVTEYEAKITGLQNCMALSAATGMCLYVLL